MTIPGDSHRGGIDLTAIREWARAVVEAAPVWCAWCHPHETRPGISHGICETHAAQMLAEAELDTPTRLADEGSS